MKAILFTIALLPMVGCGGAGAPQPAPVVQPYLFYAPNDSPITQSDYCSIATSDSSKVVLSRPIVDGHYNDCYNPAARIARFGTNSRYVGVHLDYTNLYTRTDTYNGIGWILVDSVAVQSFNQIYGAEAKVVSELMGLDGNWHDIEVLMPCGASVEFNGIDLEGTAQIRKAAVRPSVRYVAAGDSITQGYLATNSIRSWPWLLGTAKKWQVLNLGYASRRCVASDGTALGNLHPDIATYMIGYNDFSKQTPLASFKASYIAYLNNFRAICPTKKLYCITPTWSANTCGALTLEMYRQQIRDALTSLGNPLNILVEGPTLAPGDFVNFSSDPHPGDIGSANIANALIPLVNL